jgi:hypothetical protein
MISGRPDEAPQKISGTGFSDIQILKCDFTAIRTAARTNPCIYLLKTGTIQEKWSYKRMNSIQSVINQLPTTSN